jgi:HNH endonuclease/NUMOD4 motif
MGVDSLVTEERWVEVPGHDGYEVSDQGRIRSYRNRQGHPIPKPRLMTPTIVNGYLYVKLGRGFQCGLHRLVALSFLGPAPERMEVRHLDGDRRNARLDNLTYGTRAENYDDRRRHGTDCSGDRHGNRKLAQRGEPVSRRLAPADVRRIRDTTISGPALAKEMNVSAHTIYAVRHRRTWKHLP